MPWLEVEDPNSACNGQTEGWLNRVSVYGLTVWEETVHKWAPERLESELRV